MRLLIALIIFNYFEIDFNYDGESNNIILRTMIILYILWLYNNVRYKKHFEILLAL